VCWASCAGSGSRTLVTEGARGGGSARGRSRVATEAVRGEARQSTRSETESEGENTPRLTQ
jgi:hypothetical protein